MSEVSARPANFPNSLVRLCPSGFQVVEESTSNSGRHVLVGLNTSLAAKIECVDDFAVYIQLELIVSGVAGSHRCGIFVARKPRKLQFRKTSFATQAINDVEFGRLAGNCAHDPLAPLAGLIQISGDDQRVKREGGVTDPAEAVIPVAHAADK